MLKVSFFSEIILYRPYLAPLFQSVMALQTPIHVPNSCICRQIGRKRP